MLNTIMTFHGDILWCVSVLLYYSNGENKRGGHHQPFAGLICRKNETCFVFFKWATGKNSLKCAAVLVFPSDLYRGDVRCQDVWTDVSPPCLFDLTVFSLCYQLSFSDKPAQDRHQESVSQLNPVDLS